jgi:hypothetical protein
MGHIIELAQDRYLIIKKCGNVEISRNDSGKSKLHSGRNYEESKFGESLLPFSSKSYVFPSIM